MAKVLIIDDNVNLCRTLTRKLEKDTDHKVRSEHTLENGVKAVMEEDFDVVFLDVIMPDGNGLQELPNIKAASSEPEVIIITGMGDADGAALAIQNGAWDYVQKGSSLESLMLPLARSLQYREQKRSRSTRSVKRVGIIGRSQILERSLDVVAQAADSDANILIEGETGTGKELFAKAIHDNSRRSEKKFVVLDCAAVPEQLLESILFGYEKGAFTGADAKRGGLVGEADGGTLFLDEVGELPLSFQKAFLRVLQERSYRPIGAANEITSDFRLVAATNRDLKVMAEKKQFRQDLLFRINTIVMNLPPLRERPEDIKEITLHYIVRICEAQGISVKGFSPDFMDALQEYKWPGNVRELVHALERAVTLAGEDNNLYPKFLPEEMRIIHAQNSLEDRTEEKTRPEPAAAAQAERQPKQKVPDDSDLLDVLNRSLKITPDFPDYKSFRETGVGAVERFYLENLLTSVKGDVNMASEKSGLSRSRIYKLIKKHGLPKPSSLGGSEDS